MVAFLLLSSASIAGAEETKPVTRISQELAEIGGLPSAATARTAIEAPGSFSASPLAGVGDWVTIDAEGAASASAKGPSDSFTALPSVVAGDWVTIDAIASGDPSELEAELVALGARDTTIARRVVSARLPISAIPSLEGVVSLRFAHQALSTNRVGQVTSQGDHAMRADTARNQFGLDGSGVMVGVVSDSFDCQGGASGDMGSGDLPPTVTQPLAEVCPNSDEGRAMLQIIHDVAPGAALAFATQKGGQANAANSILALRDAGAKVIVDDFIYFAEPMFQDGVIAQAVDDVAASGVAYFSAAGNEARLGYDHAFVPGPFISGIGTVHNFGGTILQRVTLPPGSQFIMVLQWDSPFFSVSGAPGTQNDLDVYLLDSTGQNVIAGATTNNIASGDAVEIFGTIGCNASVPCVGNIVIANFSGPNPGRFKYILFERGGNPTTSPALNSGTIYGHGNANGAIAVGAANYKTPTTLESFSSGGTTPVLFDTDGNLLSSPDPRQFKPEIVAPDGVDTTFLGFDDGDTGSFPNFFGTSAAAPHAAGVAALMLQALPSMTPTDVRETLQDTALNMGPAGFDNNTGFGFIRADVALSALHVFNITAGPTGTPNPVIPGGAVSVSVTAEDSFGHTLTYAWTSTCTGGLPPGSFEDASQPATTWTAPLNSTGLAQTCSLKVTVTDGHGFTKTGIFPATIQSVPRITSVPAPAAVGTAVVITGTSFAGATTVTFSGPVTVAPITVTPTSVTVGVPAGARTGVFSVTTPAGVGASPAIFKVLPKITSFTPPNAVGGSTSVVDVAGTNLLAGTGTPIVKVGTMVVPQALITLHTLTALQFTIPLGAVNAKISVTTVDGTTLSPNTLTVNQPPRATGFSPNPAPVGALLTITGTNLLNVTEVSFTGGPSAPPIGTPTATSLKVQVPAGAVTGPVTVTNATGTTTSTANFRVAPTITGFTPDTAVGGSPTVIIVTGMNLRAAVNPTVKVGTRTVPANLIQTSTPTELTFTVPLGAGNGKISVTTVDGTALSLNTLTVQQPPRATGFSPNLAPVGTTLTITGTNLRNVTFVTFSGAGPVPPIGTPTATSLKVQVPAGAVTGPVTVTNGSQSSTSTVNFRVAPTITGFTPDTAVGGSPTVIIVTGMNLRAAVNPTAKVGTRTVPANLIQTSTPTELTFTVPLGAGNGKISVTTVDGTALSLNTLLVTQPPRATGFSPNPAPVGVPLTITGTNLTGATLVTFSGVGAVTFVPTDITLTSLKVVVPPDAVTGPVTVTNGSQSSTSTVNFRVAPKIATVLPGTAVGGSEDLVTVTGTNLVAQTGAQTVKVGTTTVPPGLIQSNTPTELVFKVPLGAVTAKVSVTTVDGTALSALNLTVQQPPRATAFSPNPAPVGTVLTITGTNLLGVTLVTFSGAGLVAPLAPPTATSLKVTVPPDAVTGPVTVTDGSMSSTSTVNFRVAPKIATVLPGTAVGGSEDLVTVTGTNLVAQTGAQTVKVGTTTVPPGLIQSNTPTGLVFKVPLGAVTAKVSVTTVDGTALSALNLTVQQPPRATAFSPNPAPVGTLLTITGTNLLGTTEVAFTGGVTALPIGIPTATSLKVQVPDGAVTGPVTVTNGIGFTTSTAIFKLLPKITGFTPPVAPLDSAVVVSGTNLKTGGVDPVVKVGTVAAVVVASSPTEVTFTVPALAVTGKITITTADGTATTATTLTVLP